MILINLISAMTLDPQGGRTPANTTPTSATTTKRAIDKIHSTSPIKRAKTTPIGKKQHLV